MAPLVVPNGGQLTLHWVNGTEHAYNVLGLVLTPGAVVNQATADAARGVVTTAWNSAAMAAQVDVNTVLSGAGIRDLRQPNLPQYDGVGTPLPGTAGGQSQPYSMAIVVTLRTALAGKSYRGRVYLPLTGVNAYNPETGTYSTGAATAATNFISAIRTGLSSDATLAGNFSLAVVSRERLEAHAVTSVLVRSQIGGHQDRRLPRRG